MMSLVPGRWAASSMKHLADSMALAAPFGGRVLGGQGPVGKAQPSKERIIVRRVVSACVFRHSHRQSQARIRGLAGLSL
jgi:hypothetical protein